MCTVSWLHQGEGYAVLFNRDELRTRGHARPPRIEQRGATTLVLPRDSDAGGTWIGANSHGLTLALLNEYEPAPRPPLESRGMLVDALLDSRGIPEVEERLRQLDLVRYAPFRLLSFDAAGERASARWRAETLEQRALTPADLPATSSSRDPRGAERHRRALFASQAEGAGLAGLERFHESHQPERGALSPCMHRDDAATVSFTRVVVAPESVELAYRAGPPCEGAELVALRIERSGAAAWRP